MILWAVMADPKPGPFSKPEAIVGLFKKRERAQQIKELAAAKMPHYTLRIEKVNANEKDIQASQEAARAQVRAREEKQRRRT